MTKYRLESSGNLFYYISGDGCILCWQTACIWDDFRSIEYGQVFPPGTEEGSNGSTAEPTHKEVKVIRKHCLRLCRIVGLGILLLALPVTAALAAGYLDTSFAPPNGYIERDGYSPSTVVQSDGHILFLVGDTQQQVDRLMRFSKDGQPDLAFAGTGSRVFAAGLQAEIASTPGGRIMVAGKCLLPSPPGEPDYGVSLQRLLSNGQADPSFNSGQPVCRSVNATGNYLIISRVLVQPDGKTLVLVGDYQVGDVIQMRFLLVRLTASGSLDATFGTGGILEPQVPASPAGVTLDIQNMLLQKDGRILLVANGASGPSDTGPVYLTVIRFTDLGRYDTSFDGDGVFVYANPYTTISGCNAAIQQNGRIVIVGQLSDPATTTYFLLGLTGGGAWDTGFGDTGIASLPEHACSLLVLPDDSILTGSDEVPSLVVRRFKANGTPNPSFGAAGTASYDGYTNDLSLQPGGQVILTSSSYGIQKVFLSRIGPIFADVPYIHPYHDDVEILYANGLTAGCSTTPLKFCPDQIMDRGQAAVFMVRGALGAGYVPNPTANLFQDDWTPGTWARPWAESMRETNLTTGCQLSPLLYCPWQQLPREQVVIFGLKMKYGNTYQPPAATGTVFSDMTDPNYYATAWAEKAYADGLIQSCGTSGGKPKICPATLVTRGLGAYMIVRAKNLTMP